MVSTDEAKKQATEFYEALGRAVVRWQNVESILAQIFSQLLQMLDLQDQKIAHRLFYSSRNFQTQWRLVDEAMKHEIAAGRIDDEKIVQRWASIRKALFNDGKGDKKNKSLVRTRNHIVHHIWSLNWKDGVPVGVTLPGSKAREVDPDGSITVADLSEAERRFQLFCGEVCEISADLFELSAKRRKKRTS